MTPVCFSWNSAGLGDVVVYPECTGESLMPVKKWNSVIRFIFQKGILVVRIYSKEQDWRQRGQFQWKWFGRDPEMERNELIRGRMAQTRYRGAAVLAQAVGEQSCHAQGNAFWTHLIWGPCSPCGCDSGERYVRILLLMDV